MDDLTIFEGLNFFISGLITNPYFVVFAGAFAFYMVVNIFRSVFRG